MALIEYSCYEQSLAYYGLFKLLQYPDQISAPLDYLYSEIFTDPWGDWDKIRRIFESFGTMSATSNASFSKHEDIGDGVKTTWMLNATSIGVLVQCYNIANEMGILADSTASQITFAANPTSEERVARKKWQAIALQYQIIKNIQTTQTIVGYGIAPILDSNNNLDRSPQQLQMYQSYLVKTAITASEQFGCNLSESALYKVSTTTLNALFGSVIGILRGGWWYDLLTLTPIDVEYSTETVISTKVLDVPLTFAYNPYVAHVEYAVVLPEDMTGDVSIELKECYGVEYGDSQTWDCNTCAYAGSCAGANFLNPFNMDKVIPNQINETVPVDTRVRFRYKRVVIV